MFFSMHYGVLISVTKITRVLSLLIISLHVYFNMLQVFILVTPFARVTEFGNDALSCVFQYVMMFSFQLQRLKNFGLTTYK